MKVASEQTVIENYRKMREAERDAELAARLCVLRSTEEWLRHFRHAEGLRKNTFAETISS